MTQSKADEAAASAVAAVEQVPINADDAPERTARAEHQAMHADVFTRDELIAVYGPAVGGALRELDPRGERTHYSRAEVEAKVGEILTREVQ